MSETIVFTTAELVAILGAELEKELRGVRSSSRAARRATDRALVTLVGVLAEAKSKKDERAIKAAAAQIMELTTGSLSTKLTYARKVMQSDLDLEAVLKGEGLQAAYAQLPKDPKEPKEPKEPAPVADADAEDTPEDDADDMGDIVADGDAAHRAARILAMLDKASAIVQAAHELAETVDDVDPDAVYRLTTHVARLARFAEVSISR